MTLAIFALTAALAVLLVHVLACGTVLTLRDLLIVGWLGVMSVGVAYLLLRHAQRHIGGATPVALALAEPVTAIVLALAVLGDRPAPLAFGGLAAALAGPTGVARMACRIGSVERHVSLQVRRLASTSLRLQAIGSGRD